ncbi:hypothetical protein CVT25_011399 [Psilocybe cyanescens]|uniref:Uncharacterized protein n=1 Tax=Psilocybe cyanescens TaxID=93625 RepID=A0A409WGI2_PSICY|nr:hypothetical protein CVT25_011399 [Psilocybe cyanescens]
MIMLLRVHSSLLILTVLVFSAMVTSKPTVRSHRLRDARFIAAKNLKPLKQYNMRQHATKRAELVTAPKPSKFPGIPIPVTGDEKLPIPASLSDILQAVPIATAISSTGTKLNPDAPTTGVVNSAGDVANILKALSGNTIPLDGFSGPSTTVKAPSVSNAGSPASVIFGGINSSGGKIDAPTSGHIDTPFDHTIELTNRHEVVPRNPLDGSDGTV